MNTKTYELVCLDCNKDFLALRPKDKFCSQTCRWRWRDKQPEAKVRKKISHKKWRSWNFHHRRNYMLKYTYGITSEQYEELLDKQKRCCAICERHESNFNKKMHVEHNHQTGEVQGIVCDYCNTRLLGKIRDPVLFRRAAEYLENSHTGWFVPERKKRKRRRKKWKLTDTSRLSTS